MTFFTPFVYRSWTTHFVRLSFMNDPFRSLIVHELPISFVFFNCSKKGLHSFSKLSLFSIYFVGFLTERSFIKIVCLAKSFKKIVCLFKNNFFKNLFWKIFCSAQMCEVHLQYGNNTTKWRSYTFLQLILLYFNPFSLTLYFLAVLRLISFYYVSIAHNHDLWK